MSEQKAKQARRRRAQLVRDVMALIPDTSDREKTEKIAADLLAMSDMRFAQFCLLMAKQVRQNSMRGEI